MKAKTQSRVITFKDKYEFFEELQFESHGYYITKACVLKNDKEDFFKITISKDFENATPVTISKEQLELLKDMISNALRD